MTRDALHRLRAADPARGLNPQPPEGLLRALVAAPRPARRRSQRALRVTVPIALTAAVAAVVTLVPGGSSPDLAAKAYAQTAPGSRQILHVRTTQRATIQRPGKDPLVELAISEQWQRAGVSHRITRYGPDLRHETEETLDSNGVLRLRFDGGKDTSRRADGSEQREYIDRVSSGFLVNFRRDYERGRLDQSSEVTFAGRPARRYVVTRQDARGGAGGPPPPETEEYYLDAETGAPLGSRQVFTMYQPLLGKDHKVRPDHDRPSSKHSHVTTVDALEHLPPTPENLAKLSG